MKCWSVRACLLAKEPLELRELRVAQPGAHFVLIPVRRVAPRQRRARGTANRLRALAGISASGRYWVSYAGTTKQTAVVAGKEGFGSFVWGKSGEK